MKPHRRRAVRFALAAFAIALAAFAIPTIWLKPWSVDHLYMRLLVELVWQSPETCTQLHLLDWRRDELDDGSLAHRDAVIALVQKERATLRSFDRASMSPVAKDSFDVMDTFLGQLLANDGRIAGGPYTVNQLDGLHVAFPRFLIEAHDIANVRDARTFVARVGASGRAFDQAIAVAEDEAKRGVVPPRFILAKVRADASAFAAHAAKDNPIAVSFAEKIAKVASIDDATRAELQKDLEARIENVVRPAYARWLALVDALDRASSDDAGLWKLPDGDARYKTALAIGTTTDTPPEEVHALGLAQVARIESEMKAALAALGHADEEPAAAMSALAKDERFHYPDTEGGRRAMLADFQAILDEADAWSKTAFNKRPPIGVRVEAVPDFRAKTSPGGQYSPAPLDDSRPATFFANPSARTPKFMMRTLAFHEAIPGHHFQIALAMHEKELPPFRKLVPFNAYVEGWALYAEQLAAESGLERDPMDRLGFLGEQLLRATRLVVDTGLHKMRWTRAQAVDFMTHHTTSDAAEIEIEVGRYVVWPGQACGYMVGMLKILELRDRAKSKLGARFDLKDFHDTVLSAGSVPLTVLESIVERWIASRS